LPPAFRLFLSPFTPTFRGGRTVLRNVENNKTGPHKPPIPTLDNPVDELWKIRPGSGRSETTLQGLSAR
jgi:hypothetical protein